MSRETSGTGTGPYFSQEPTLEQQYGQVSTERTPLVRRTLPVISKKASQRLENFIRAAMGLSQVNKKATPYQYFIYTIRQLALYMGTVFGSSAAWRLGQIGGEIGLEDLGLNPVDVPMGKKFALNTLGAAVTGAVGFTAFNFFVMQLFRLSTPPRERKNFLTRNTLVTAQQIFCSALITQFAFGYAFRGGLALLDAANGANHFIAGAPLFLLGSLYAAVSQGVHQLSVRSGLVRAENSSVFEWRDFTAMSSLGMSFILFAWSLIVDDAWLSPLEPQKAHAVLAALASGGLSSVGAAIPYLIMLALVLTNYFTSSPAEESLIVPQDQNDANASMQPVFKAVDKTNFVGATNTDGLFGDTGSPTPPESLSRAAGQLSNPLYVPQNGDSAASMEGGATRSPAALSAIFVPMPSQLPQPVEKPVGSDPLTEAPKTTSNFGLSKSQ